MTEPRAGMCPECGREVAIGHGGYAEHDRMPPLAVRCALSGQPYEGPVHTVTWVLDRDRVVGRFGCAAAPGAVCRSHCTRQGCMEEGCEDAEGHDWVAQDSCNYLDYLENCDGDAAEHYAGASGVRLREGEVRFTWDGQDCFTWAYADADEPR